MSDAGERELIEALTRDLQPVTPAPRLRTGLLLVLASVGLCAVFFAATLPTPAVLVARLAAAPLYAAVLSSLVLAGVAGAVAALASAAPDRDALLRTGVGLAAAAVALAALGCGIGLVGADASTGPFAPAHVGCFSTSLLAALAPAGVIAALLLRGWVGRPVLGAVAALAGALALGAMVVHAQCAAVAPGHLLWGHLAVPLVGTAAGIVPLSWVLRRYAR